MIQLIHGDASKWVGNDVDLVFTHPYAMIPRTLWSKPMIINLFGNKKGVCEKWIGGRKLTKLSTWGKDQMNTIYVVNLEPVNIDLTDLKEDNTDLEKGGWFPLELPMRLLKLYGQEGYTVWDGFMGRGTVGKACKSLGMSYIGIDRDVNRIMYAQYYLGVKGTR